MLTRFLLKTACVSCYLAFCAATAAALAATVGVPVPAGFVLGMIALNVLAA